MRRIVIALILLMGMAGIAAAQNYKIRPGDKLDVNVWQDPKLNRVVVVAPDGRISFPLAGQMRVSGRSLEAVEAELKKRLGSQYSEDIDITVAYVDRPPDPPKEKAEKVLPGVFVMGEVGKPGKVEYRNSMNVLQALASAGGLSPFAADKRIKIRRKTAEGETLIDFNYDDFVSGKDLSGNVLLRNGDVIIVPERGLFE
jgi:polysaccharide export outer membrane protein